MSLPGDDARFATLTGVVLPGLDARIARSAGHVVLRLGDRVVGRVVGDALAVDPSDAVIPAPPPGVIAAPTPGADAAPERRIPLATLIPGDPEAGPDPVAAAWLRAALVATAAHVPATRTPDPVPRIPHPRRPRT